MIKLFAIFLWSASFSVLATQVIDNDGSFLRFRGSLESLPYGTLLSDKSYGDSLIEEQNETIESEIETEKSIHPKDIDQDALFKSTGIWSDYKKDDYNKYYARLLRLKRKENFKAYYLLGEIYRLGMATRDKDLKKAIYYYSLALMECAQGIIRDQQILVYHYRLSKSDEVRKALAKEILAFYYDAEKRSRRLKEKELVHILALEKLNLCKDQKEQESIECKSIIFKPWRTKK